MAIEQWHPFQDILSLRDAMDRLMQESFVRPGNLLGISSQISLPLDVAEHEGEFVVHASLPGVKPEDLQITIQGDLLTIRGETKTEEERKGQRWILREQRSGMFQRSVRLPVQVNADQVQATFEHGMLTLTLPKSEAAKAKQISINAQPQIGATPTTLSQGRTDEMAGRPSAAQQGQVSQQPGYQGQSVGQPTSQGQAAGQNRVNEASRESFPASDAPTWQQTPQP